MIKYVVLYKKSNARKITTRLMVLQRVVGWCETTDEGVVTHIGAEFLNKVGDYGRSRYRLRVYLTY